MQSIKASCAHSQKCTIINTSIYSVFINYMYVSQKCYKIVVVDGYV